LSMPHLRTLSVSHAVQRASTESKDMAQRSIRYMAKAQRHLRPQFNALSDMAGTVSAGINASV
jgi:hypothetical protein